MELAAREVCVKRDASGQRALFLFCLAPELAKKLVVTEGCSATSAKVSLEAAETYSVNQKFFGAPERQLYERVPRSSLKVAESTDTVLRSALGNF